MNLVKNLAVILCVLLAGFSPINSYSEESSNDILKKQLAFGDSSSKLHVYVFTDWLCPYCKKLEPSLKDIVPKISKIAQVTFVDVAIHPESSNFIPYNISFMLNNKPEYLSLRTALDKLSSDTKTPSDKQVAEAIQPTGIVYKKLNNSQILDATNYFLFLMQKFNVNRTPTIVVENEKTNKFKTIDSLESMTEENISKTIESVR